MTSAAHILTLSVTLIGTEPTIWRRVEVDGDVPLDRFHDLLQAAMGWTDSHGHAFVDHDPFVPPAGGLSIVPRVWHAAEALATGAQGFNESTETVANAVHFGGGSLWYEYDFGDGWVHVIREESRRPRSAEDPEARVVDGARRGPLEDCGGISGWANLLDIWSGPVKDAAEHADAVAWVQDMQDFGRPFDPEDFDVAAANVDHALNVEGRRIAALLEEQGIDDDEAADRFLRRLDRSDAAIQTRHQAGRWVATLNPWCQREFGAALHRAGIDPLGRPEESALPPQGEAALRPYQWLIRACEGDGLPLTPKGNLNQASVIRVVQELGWNENESVYGTGKTENVAPIVAMLRESGLGAGFVKKAGKKLLATAAGRQMVDDPAGLWARLCERAIPSRTSEYNRDVVMLELLVTALGSTGGKDLVDNGVWKGLELIGYARPDGVPLSESWFIRNVEQLNSTQRVLASGCRHDAAGRSVASTAAGARGRRVLRDFALAVLQS